MMNIKVLGAADGSRDSAVKLIEKVANAAGVSIKLEQVESEQEILKYGAIATPSIMIDGKMVHSGGVPNESQIEIWLGAETECCGCCGND